MMGLAACTAEIAKVRDEPVSAAELDEASNETHHRSAAGPRNLRGPRGLSLPIRWSCFGDPAASDHFLAAVQRVTAADVQRVATPSWTTARAVTQCGICRSKSRAAQPATPSPTSTTIQAVKRAFPCRRNPPFMHSRRWPSAKRRPNPGSHRRSAPARHAEKTLANGLRVIVAT